MNYFNSMGGGLLAAALLIAPVAQAQGYDPMRPNYQAPAAAQEGEDAVALNPDLGNLPDTEGAEETFYQCIACHSTTTFTQQRLSDERWDYLWDWMVEDQGMYEPDAETKEIILTYLKRHFSSER